MNALNHHWCEISLLPQAVLKQVVSRDFILKNILCMRLVLYPAKNKEIYAYLVFPCHFTSLLKGKLQHMGHEWGHIWIAVMSLDKWINQI